MKKCVVLSILLLSPNLFTQVNADTNRTINYANGGYWNQLNQSEKISYLNGLSDMAKYFFSTLELSDVDNNALSTAQKLYDVFSLNGYNLDNVRLYIDKIYEDINNFILPITDVLDAYFLQAKGASKEAIDIYYNILRKAYGTVKKNK